MNDAADPVKIVTIDIEDGLRSIPSGGSPLVWVLVRASGRPFQLLSLRPDGAAVTEAQLTAAVGPPPTDGGEPAVGDDRLPLISIVVPSMLERAQTLGTCLASLLAQDYPRFELLLVDNRPAGSPEPQDGLIAEGLTRLREPRPGIAAARNRGLSAARGTIIAFTDDDVRADPGWLRAIGEHFVHHPDDAAVSGLVMPAELVTDAQMQFEAFYGGGFGERRELRRLRWRVENPASLGIPGVEVVERDEDGRKLRTFTLYAAGSFGAGVNVAFRSDALRAIGGFRAELGTGTPSRSGEDLHAFASLMWRGETIAYEPAALVYHAHRRDVAGLQRQIAGYGTGFVAFLIALVLEDPRHLVRITATLPRALTAAGRRLGAKLAGRRTAPVAEATAAQVTPHQLGTGSRDRQLARAELTGMAQGLPAYLRARRDSRQWEQRHARR